MKIRKKSGMGNGRPRVFRINTGYGFADYLFYVLCRCDWVDTGQSQIQGLTKGVACSEAKGESGKFFLNLGFCCRQLRSIQKN